MTPKEPATIRSEKRRTGPCTTGSGEMTVAVRLCSRSRFNSWFGLPLLLASCSISVIAMAQQELKESVTRPAADQSEDASDKRTAPDGASAPPEVKTDPETTGAPSPAAQPVDATLASDEPPRGTVVFTEPLAPADRSSAATDASDSVAGPRPVSTGGERGDERRDERRDDAPAECEAEWMREGLYLRIFDGAGYAHLFGDGPSDSTSISGMGAFSAFAIGGSIAPRLVLAFTIQAVQTSGEFEGGPLADARLSVEGNEMSASGTASATAALLGAFVDWYPMESSGLHLGLGVGLNSLMVVNGADDSTLVGMGGGASLVVGYDWPIARTWALGIALVAFGATNAVLMDSESGDDTDYDLMPISVGLSASILYF